MDPKWDAASVVLDPTHLYDARIYQRDETQDGFGIDWLVVSVQTVHCPIGQALAQVLFMVECVQCPEEKVSREGLECLDCPIGKVPNA
eukprot:SAG31_NODE_44194_length_263_cov_3.902439_1_plen_87_part_11